MEEFAAELAKGGSKKKGHSVKEYADLLRQHLLAFIGRRDYVAEIKEERRSPEWQLYRQYILDERLSLLAQMGLTLRSWESDPAHKRDIERLRSRISFKYGEEGLHIAQVVQSRVLTGVVPTVMRSVESKERVARLIEAFLAGSARLCRFVKESDPPAAVAREVADHLSRNRPPVFVLFARGSAIPTCNLVVKLVVEASHSYRLEVHDVYGSRIVVLLRSDIGKGPPQDLY